MLFSCQKQEKVENADRKLRPQDGCIFMSWYGESHGYYATENDKKPIHEYVILIKL